MVVYLYYHNYCIFKNDQTIIVSLMNCSEDHNTGIKLIEI